MIGKRSSSRLSMPKLKHLTNLFPWREKQIHIVLMVKSQYRVTNTKTKILRLRRHIALYPSTRVIIEMKVNQSKLLVKPRRIFIQTVKSNKTGLPHSHHR